ncbi:peptidoglycan-binding domain-containing protein [Streptomyces pratensis]|uniref:peptidoglycan-binding domain-containing protein n=1 Tax=Streptomyces pratensis TaxID=1169025 RepID=UPI003019DAFD
MTASLSSRSRGLPLTAALALAAVAAAVLPVATAAPAHAALPQCTQAVRSILPLSSSGSPDCVMGVGNGGEAVKRLQNSLRLCNGQSIAVDGVYGAKTRDAVKNVQRRYRITVDGVYGPQTRDAMSWYIGADCSGL